MRSSRLTPSRALGAACVALATAAGTLTAAYPAFAAGEAPLTALDTAYIQNFDTLASTGTSSTLPTGWYLLETGTSASADGAYAAGTGSSNGGNTYSFGTGADRALGSVQSGTLVPSFGVKLVNGTDATLTSADISYVGEQW